MIPVSLVNLLLQSNYSQGEPHRQASGWDRLEKRCVNTVAPGHPAYPPVLQQELIRREPGLQRCDR